MTAFFYLAKSYLKTFLGIAFVILVIVVIVDGIDQFKVVEDLGGDKGKALVYILLRLPNSLYNFLPLLFLLASLFFFLGLARHSELVALRAAGVSAFRIVCVPIIMTIFLSLVIIGPYHLAMVKARTMSSDLISTLKGQPSDIIRTINRGIWLRENQGEDTRFIFIPRVNWKEKVFPNMEVFIKNPGKDTQHLIVKNGRIADGEWDLRGVQISQAARNSNAQSGLQNLKLPTKETFESLFADYLDPKTVPLYELPKFITELEKDGYDILPAKTLLYSELSQPLFLGFLCLLGSIFALAPMRGGGTSTRVLLALGTGFAFYFLTKLTESASKVGDIPIIVGVFCVPIAGSLFALSILLHKEDG